MTRSSYVLTARAAADLKEARAWSRARWGKELTAKYFEDLHEAAQSHPHRQTPPEEIDRASPRNGRFIATISGIQTPGATSTASERMAQMQVLAREVNQ